MKTRYLLMMTAKNDSEEEARALMEENDIVINEDMGQNVKRDKVLSCIFIKFQKIDEARVYIIKKSSLFDEILLYDIDNKIVLIYKSSEIDENLDTNLSILKEGYEIINPRGIVINDIKNITHIHEEIFFMYKTSAN